MSKADDVIAFIEHHLGGLLPWQIERIRAIVEEPDICHPITKPCGHCMLCTSNTLQSGAWSPRERNPVNFVKCGRCGGAHMLSACPDNPFSPARLPLQEVRPRPDTESRED